MQLSPQQLSTVRDQLLIILSANQAGITASALTTAATVGQTGEAVRSRTARWEPHGADPGVSENGVERVAELTSSVTDEEPEGGGALVEVHQ